MGFIYELRSDVIDAIFLTGGSRKVLHNLRERLSNKLLDP